MTRIRPRTALAGLAAALACVLVLGVSNASADSIQYTLTTGNSGGLDCCTGPYATVAINLTTSTTATVTFDSLTNGGYLYLMAATGAVGVNVNASTFGVGTITGTNSLAGFSPGPYSVSSGNEDGFGSFNLSIDSFDGFKDSATEISFVLTDTSGTWASASNVLTGNNDNNIAAIHGFACAQPGCSITSGAYATGYASNAVVSTTPEPVSMVLMGTFLFASYALLRRKLTA